MTDWESYVGPKLKCSAFSKFVICKRVFSPL